MNKWTSGKKEKRKKQKRWLHLYPHSPIHHTLSQRTLKAPSVTREISEPHCTAYISISTPVERLRGHRVTHAPANL
ncbi:hypothetical protein MHYP_G00023890 [Metynnis hypsauchen]